MHATSNTDILAWLDSARVFFGELTAAAARVYVELDRAEAGEGLSLQGRIVGPYSKYSHTLRTSVPLRELECGATRLCAALLPDPCCWTPLLPFTYSLELAAVQDGKTIASGNRTFGLRPLGVRRNDLFLDGKRVVLRAVDRQAAPHSTVADWLKARTSLYVRGFDEALLEECTTHGVLACVEVSDAGANLDLQLHQVARHASAGIVLLPREAFGAELRTGKPRNLLLASITCGEGPIPGEAQLIAWQADSAADFPERFDDLSRPVIAVISSDGTAPVEELRRQCDALQAALAGRGRLAGFVIRNNPPNDAR